MPSKDHSPIYNCSGATEIYKELAGTQKLVLTGCLLLCKNKIYAILIGKKEKTRNHNGMKAAVGLENEGVWWTLTQKDSSCWMTNTHGLTSSLAASQAQWYIIQCHKSTVPEAFTPADKDNLQYRKEISGTKPDTVKSLKFWCFF